MLISVVFQYYCQTITVSLCIDIAPNRGDSYMSDFMLVFYGFW